MKRTIITTTIRTRKCIGHAIAQLRATAITEFDHRTVTELERIHKELGK